MPRPLLVTADPVALDDLTRLAALAGVDATAVHDVSDVRRHWDAAPFVVVGEDALPGLVLARPRRRDGVVVLGRDLDGATVWQHALDVGAERVVRLPDGERWLVEALADAAEGTGARGTVLAVVGGRGGAGATTLACALAHDAALRGSQAVLVDGDPLGGGVDVVFGAEGEPGLRWPELCGSRGRVPAAALARALPRSGDLALLSWDRGEHVQLPPEAVRSVLSAVRRSYDLVVVDVSRQLDDVAREVLLAASTTLLVVPSEVRAVAAAARVATRVAEWCSDLRLVVRGPGPAALGAHEVAHALLLPLAGEVRTDSRVARALEEGAPPPLRRGSPLAVLCQGLLGPLLAPPARAA